MFVLILQRLSFEALLDVLYFPVWWYTGGALRAGKWCANLFLEGNLRLAPGLWLSNIFVPMFGQYDWQGRIISFVMRFIQVIFRSIILVFWLGFCVALFFVWLIIPVVIVTGIIRSAFIN